MIVYVVANLGSRPVVYGLCRCGANGEWTKETAAVLDEAEGAGLTNPRVYYSRFGLPLEVFRGGRVR